MTKPNYLHAVTIKTHTLTSAMNIIEFLEVSSFNKVTGKSIRWNMNRIGDHFHVHVQEPINEEIVDMVEIQFGVCEVLYDEPLHDTYTYVYVHPETYEADSPEPPEFFYLNYRDENFMQPNLWAFNKYDNLLELMAETPNGGEIIFDDITITVDHNEIECFPAEQETE
jgi:hypothetical protein